jgi:hypothetical protein
MGGGTLASPAVRTPPAGRTSASALALATLLSCHRAADPPRPAARPDPAAVTDRVRIVLIAPDDWSQGSQGRQAGRAGRPAGCGDSAVPVEVTLPSPAPALAGALGALLSLRQRLDPASGLYDPLYASELQVVGVDRAGGEARVRLSGYLELGDACEARRILAQLEGTATQFEGIRRAAFTVDGQPLEELLAAAPKDAHHEGGALRQTPTLRHRSPLS